MNTKNIYHIYKIECKQDNTLFYIGITSDYIQRINSHKSNCNGKNNLKVYQIIRENGGSDNFNFFIIDTFYCIKQIAYDIESTFIYKLRPPMNSNIPYNSKIQNLDDYKISSYQLRNKNLYNNETNNETNTDDILDRLYIERQRLYTNETNNETYNKTNNNYELDKQERRRKQVRLAQRRYMERKRLNNNDTIINETNNESNNETNNESNNESNNETNNKIINESNKEINNLDKLHETLKSINNNIILLQNILNKKSFLHKRKKYINVICWK